MISIGSMKIENSVSRKKKLWKKIKTTCMGENPHQNSSTEMTTMTAIYPYWKRELSFTNYNDIIPLDILSSIKGSWYSYC